MPGWRRRNQPGHGRWPLKECPERNRSFPPAISLCRVRRPIGGAPTGAPADGESLEKLLEGLQLDFGAVDEKNDPYKLPEGTPAQPGSPPTEQPPAQSETQPSSPPAQSQAPAQQEDAPADNSSASQPESSNAAPDQPPQ